MRDALRIFGSVIIGCVVLCDCASNEQAVCYKALNRIHLRRALPRSLPRFVRWFDDAAGAATLLPVGTRGNIRGPAHRKSPREDDAGTRNGAGGLWRSD